MPLCTLFLAAAMHSLSPDEELLVQAGVLGDATRSLLVQSDCGISSPGETMFVAACAGGGGAHWVEVFWRGSGVMRVDERAVVPYSALFQQVLDSSPQTREIDDAVALLIAGLGGITDPDREVSATVWTWRHVWCDRIASNSQRIWLLIVTRQRADASPPLLGAMRAYRDALLAESWPADGRIPQVAFLSIAIRDAAPVVEWLRETRPALAFRERNTLYGLATQAGEWAVAGLALDGELIEAVAQSALIKDRGDLFVSLLAAGRNEEAKTELARGSLGVPERVEILDRALTNHLSSPVVRDAISDLPESAERRSLMARLKDLAR